MSAAGMEIPHHLMLFTIIAVLECPGKGICGGGTCLRRGGQMPTRVIYPLGLGGRGGAVRALAALVCSGSQWVLRSCGIWIEWAGNSTGHMVVIVCATG